MWHNRITMHININLCALFILLEECGNIKACSLNIVQYFNLFIALFHLEYCGIISAYSLKK